MLKSTSVVVLVTPPAVIFIIMSPSSPAPVPSLCQMTDFPSAGSDGSADFSVSTKSAAVTVPLAVRLVRFSDPRPFPFAIVSMLRIPFADLDNLVPTVPVMVVVVDHVIEFALPNNMPSFLGYWPTAAIRLVL